MHRDIFPFLSIVADLEGCKLRSHLFRWHIAHHRGINLYEVLRNLGILEHEDGTCPGIVVLVPSLARHTQLFQGDLLLPGCPVFPDVHLLDHVLGTRLEDAWRFEDVSDEFEGSVSLSRIVNH